MVLLFLVIGFYGYYVASLLFVLCSTPSCVRVLSLSLTFCPHLRLLSLVSSAPVPTAFPASHLSSAPPPSPVHLHLSPPSPHPLISLARIQVRGFFVQALLSLLFCSPVPAVIFCNKCCAVASCLPSAAFWVHILHSQCDTRRPTAPPTDHNFIIGSHRLIRLLVFDAFKYQNGHTTLLTISKGYCYLQ